MDAGSKSPGVPPSCEMPKKIKRQKKPRSKAEDEEPKKHEMIVRPVPGKLVDIYAEGDDTTVRTLESMAMALSARKNRDTDFKRASDIKPATITLPPFALQFLFQSRTINQGSILEIIGPEGCGKSTLALTLAAYAMNECRASVLWLNADTKDMLPERIMRIMSPYPLTGKMMMDNLKVFRPHSLDQMWETMLLFVRQERGLLKKAGKRAVSLPINQPLVVIVDPFGRLMSPGEAEGFQLYGSYMEEKDKKKAEGLLSGSNFEHAKFAARWTRRLGYLCDAMNVILIVVSEQNTKIDMSGPGPGFSLPESYVQSHNKTKLGGGALNKAAAYQVILGLTGMLKDSAGNIVGRAIRARMDKNSHGASSAEIVYGLHEMTPLDSPGYLEPALQFDSTLAELIMAAKNTDLTAGQCVYNWPSQSLNGVPPIRFGYEVEIARPHILAQYADLYHIRGYRDFVAEAVAAAKEQKLLK